MNVYAKTRGDTSIIFANILLVLKMMLESSSLINLNEWVETSIDILIVGIIILHLLKQKYSKAELLFIFTLGIICSYSCLVVKNYYLIFALLFIISMKNVNISLLLSYRVLIKVTIIGIHTIIFLFTFVFDYETLPEIVRNGVVRYDFFLGQPNTCQMYILWTCVEIIYVYYKKLKAVHLFILFGINVFYFLFTNSNTSFLLCILMVVFILGEKKGVHWIMKLYNAVASNGFWVCSVLFGGIVMTYSVAPSYIKQLYALLDQTFTGRIAYGGYTFHLYGFTFFGQAINYTGLEQWNGQWFDNLYLDNAYLWLMLSYGIIYIIIITIAIKKFVPYMTELEKICIALMILYAITEGYILDISKCFPLIILGNVYYRIKRLSNIKKLSNMITVE